MRNYKKRELLIPAGGRTQLIAAVENGADAVYLGGRMLNARVSAENFSDQEMQEAVDFAHKRGVKIYVTMNTLVMDEEMQDALEYAIFLYKAGVDALIIQDFGFAYLLRKRIPDLPLHLSTQATVYDAEGVRAAEKLGFERAVLARELSLKEIEEVSKNSSAELEVFVHGAICICYSGQCQLSRYFGGRSGNRGSCAQPCRLPYTVLDKNGKKINKGRYPLSPKDLSFLEHLDEILDAGVLSLKVEGRMKSPEYVAIVTSIFRKYLDRYEKTGSTGAISDRDRFELTQIFSRNGFTDAYFRGKRDPEMMESSIPKHQGIYIGKVIKRIDHNLIDVKLYDKLQQGDGVEVHADRLTGNIVTYYKELKNGLTRIGDIHGRVQHGDGLYRTSSKDQKDQAARSFQSKDYITGNFIRKIPVNMEISIEGSGLKVSAHSVGADPGADYSCETSVCEHSITEVFGPFEIADEKPTPIERIEAAFKKSGGTPFEVEGVRILGANNLRLRMSDLNAARRIVLEKMEESFIVRGQGEVDSSFIKIPEEMPVESIEIFYHSLDDFFERDLPYQLMQDIEAEEREVRAVLPLAEFDILKDFRAIETRLRELAMDSFVPYISNVAKGREKAIVKRVLKKHREKWEKTGVYVGNLGCIEMVSELGIEIYGDFGLNAYNFFAPKALKVLGMEHLAPGLENEEKEAGDLPLMTTQYDVPGRWFVDRKKDRLQIIKRRYSDQTILVPQNGEFFAEIKEHKKTFSDICRIYI